MTIAIDTETHLIENGQQAPRVVCLQYGDTKRVDIVTQDSILEHFEKLLDGKEVLVGQNTAYDMAVLCAKYPELLPKVFQAYDDGRVQCTRLRERLLDISKGQTGPQTSQRSYYSMDTIIKRRGIRFDVDKKSPWRMKYAELEKVPVYEWPVEALEYARDDPKATLLIYQSQRNEAVALEYNAFEDEAARQAAYDFTMHLMRCWGVRTDPKRVKALLHRTVARLKEIEPELLKAGVMKKSGSKLSKDMSAIRARVEKCLGNAAPLTPAGSVKTDADTVEKCDDKVLTLVTEHAYLTKMKNTYILKFIEGITGNIHASFHTLGADSGRTSSSNPNLQNQPRKGGARECIVPREGCVFISADYDSQELRTLAQACKDLVGYSSLAEMYQGNPDFDPHTAFAAQLMGWTYGDAMARKDAGDKEVLERRQQAKAANFGFPGGLGAPKFMEYARTYGVKLTIEEAQELRNAWFQQWPEMKDYFTHVKHIANSGKLVQLRSGRVRGDIGFTDGANSYFQGLASEASKTAVYEVAKRCYAKPNSALYDSRPVMLVHDEIMVETPENKAHEAAMELQECMVGAMKLWCPDVPARATPVVARCWSKDAKPLTKEGKLVPWDLSDDSN